jgi:hypothetical protein
MSGNKSQKQTVASYRKCCQQHPALTMVPKAIDNATQLRKAAGCPIGRWLQIILNAQEAFMLQSGARGSVHRRFGCELFQYLVWKYGINYQHLVPYALLWLYFRLSGLPGLQGQ